MADLPDLPPPSQLWKQLPLEKKAQAADAFWRDENAIAEQREAIAAIAQRLKFRPKSVVGLPVERKARYLLGLPAVSELLAARLLVAYHVFHQRPMMGSFLDAVGIRHDEGLIADEQLQPPQPEALRSAAVSLRASYPEEDVQLYFTTLLWQDPETWGGLSELLEAQ